jgi:glutamate/aspartate transport system substrate-binding protein
MNVKFQPVTSQNRIPLMQNGTIDIECGSTTNNAARQKDVAFAVTTFVEEVRIAAKANSGISSIAQLDQTDVLITDTGLDLDARRTLERTVRQLIVVDPAATEAPDGRAD